MNRLSPRAEIGEEQQARKPGEAEFAPTHEDPRGVQIPGVRESFDPIEKTPGSAFPSSTAHLPRHLELAVQLGKLTVEDAESYLPKPERVVTKPRTFEELPRHLQMVIESGRHDMTTVMKWIGA